MSDLRDRFQTLDRVPVPALWAEALRRAAELEATPLERPRLARRRREGRNDTTKPAWRATPSLAWALLLLVLALAVTVGVGAWLRAQDNQVVEQPTPTSTAAPSTAPTASPRGPLSACPGATTVEDIRDTHLPDNAGLSWTSAGRPSGEAPGRGSIATTGSDPAREGAASIVLVEPEDGTACRLADLPGGDSVWALRWSPAGDALAIELRKPDLGPFELLVWSSAGLTRVWTGVHPPGVTWSPDGQALAMPENAVVAMLQASGAPPKRFPCMGCEPGGLVAWSPSGAMVARHAATALDSSVMFGEIGGPGLQRLELDVSHVEVVAWLDEETLVVHDLGAGRLLEVPLDAPDAFTVIASLPVETMARILSPDRRSAAGLDDSGRELLVTDLATGETKVVAFAGDVAPASMIEAFAWAPDSGRLAYTIRGSAGFDQDMVLGIWEVEPDGGAPRQITAEPLVLDTGRFDGPADHGGPWQPLWP